MTFGIPGVSSRRHLLTIGAVVGLGYGLIEATESYLLSLFPGKLGWWNGNSVNALWTVPVLYLIAYTALTLVVIALSRVVRRRWWDRVLLFGLTSLSAYLAAKNQDRAFSEWASLLLGLGFGSVVLRIYARSGDVWRRGSGWPPEFWRPWPRLWR